MTIIKADMIADSVSSAGVRICSIECTYPRYIHAEVMTHRVFSRNSASSRAIPVAKQLDAISENPVTPIVWGINKSGMQSEGELDGWRLRVAQFLWAWHRRHSLITASLLMGLGLHKQWANRLTEPHSHIKVLITSTDWANFLALREHSAAMPEIYELAVCIREAMLNSLPVKMKHKEWHTPYVSQSDLQELAINRGEQDLLGNAIRLSVARCARTSYTTFEFRERPIEDDLKLAERLLNSKPLHASPMEHQATPDPGGKYSHQFGNFRGWIQFRKTLGGECVPDINFAGAPATGMPTLKIQPTKAAAE